METLKLRNLTFEEAATLDAEDEFFVPARGTTTSACVSARLDHGGLGQSAREILESGVPSGQSVPTVNVSTRYGTVYAVSAGDIYTADPDGTDHKVLDDVGTQVSLTLFAPGMEGPDVLERARKALRAEFGPGILQLRQETHRPVAETGLPPVLGVPDGQIPRFI